MLKSPMRLASLIPPLDAAMPPEAAENYLTRPRAACFKHTNAAAAALVPLFGRQ